MEAQLLGKRGRRALALIAAAVIGLVAAGVAYVRPRLPVPASSQPARGPMQVCDLSFATPQHGAVVLCSSDRPDESVYITLDAGRSWRPVRSGPIADGRVRWFSNSQAVLVGYVGQAVSVWMSSDGGRGWSARSSAPAPTLPYTDSLPQFADPLHGVHFWYLDSAAPVTSRGPHPVELWRTQDGARTWQRATGAGIPRQGFKQLLLFPSAREGFLGLATSAAPGVPSLLKTTDGAESWTAVPLPVAARPPVSPYGWGMVRSGTQLVFWIEDSEAESGRVRLSSSVSGDGGATWSAFSAGPYAAGRPPMVDDRGWLVVQEDDTRFWMSTDAGRTWSATAIGAPPGVRNLELRQTIGGTVLAVGGRESAVPAGHLFRSDDLGRHWQELRLPASAA